MEGVEFVENSAKIFTGGAIGWENTALVDKGITFDKNSAPSGSNMASNGVKANLVTGRLLGGQTLSIPSGQNH